ncbi:hypothetical protein Avbf_11781, partial [Armadillidium vulgare]
LCSKLTVNSLKERGLDDGHIINISSIAARQVLPFGSSHFYTGTKFAVRALSEGLRQELQAANSGIKLSVLDMIVAPRGELKLILSNRTDEELIEHLFFILFFKRNL